MVSWRSASLGLGASVAARSQRVAAIFNNLHYETSVIFLLRVALDASRPGFLPAGRPKEGDMYAKVSISGIEFPQSVRGGGQASEHEKGLR